MNAAFPRTAPPPTTVSTHILDTSAGRPATGVAVHLSVSDGEAGWTAHGVSYTDGDGRCKNFPALPAGTTRVRLCFEVEDHLAGRTPRTASDAGEGREANNESDGAFFPDVTVVFRVDPGEHYHVPLLLNPYGYSVYRGS